MQYLQGISDIASKSKSKEDADGEDRRLDESQKVLALGRLRISFPVYLHCYFVAC
jgi:hypothetical protein